jgi:flavorubredoxin
MFTFPDPLRIADCTYLIRPLERIPGVPLAMHVNSLVVQGAEPLIVDTGAARFREEWIEQVFGLVDPHDVRWIFLSHDGRDHTGNLEVALEMCPRATLITSWFASLRVCGKAVVAPERQCWVADGETVELADRRLVAVRPPTYDSSATLGLYDSSTGVFWSSVAFGTAVAGLVDSVADLPAPFWEEASTTFSSLLSPWHTVADPAKFGAAVDRIAALEPSVIASAHGPVVGGTSIGPTLERMRGLPDLGAARHPGPDVFDRLPASPAT